VPQNFLNPLRYLIECNQNSTRIEELFVCEWVLIPSGKIKGGGNEEVLVVKMKDKIIKKSDKIYHPSFKKL
jgi:hypothetical protein